MLQRNTEWKPDYAKLLSWRARQLARMKAEPDFAQATWHYYSTRPVEFIHHWCDTFDPRNAVSDNQMARMPFVLFKRQIELVQFFHACLRGPGHGLVEKSRDMGATWAGISYSVWLWLFVSGSQIGWGSRVAGLVDDLDDPDSIFQKARMLIKGLPAYFLPQGFSPDDLMKMRLVNRETGATITGEGGDDIGRGGRKLVYFVDEAAHLEHPETIEASLSENTRVRIDLSSVNGLGNVFHRKREAGVEWEPGQAIERYKTNVFIMDWRDHPMKTQEWYDGERQRKIDQGLQHLFAQEVERNYAASVEGTIIPVEFIRSAIDAHLALPELDGWYDGGFHASLDVADSGTDRNALTVCEGVVLVHADEWGERDTGATARRAIAAIAKHAPVDLQYDVIGVGTGVKSESNRLKDEGLMPRGVRLIPWDAGASPLNPDKHVGVMKNGLQDRNTPLNKDFYGNLKAQGWWELRIRFERTHQMVQAKLKGEELPKYKVSQLISLDSKRLGNKMLRIAEKELAQVTRKAPTGRMKLIVDKQPEGTRSPNVGDSVMMNYWPANGFKYDTSNKWVR